MTGMKTKARCPNCGRYMAYFGMDIEGIVWHCGSCDRAGRKCAWSKREILPELEV